MSTSIRVLPLEGGRNFRDLGGYATADGQRVKWGKLYRSGSMAKLTLADYDYLAKLGIRVVCDFRTTAERDAEPNRWQEVAKLKYWTRDYLTGFGELRKVMASDLASGHEARAAMIAGYRGLPFEQAPAYRELFKRLAAGELPLVFNCSAGKDRAGTAAAIVLTALGVPRETVLEDYLLTAKVVDFRLAFAEKAEGPPSPLAGLSPDVVTAIFNADPEYIGTALTAIETKFESIEFYLRDVLDISLDELHAIRQQLLEQ